eukprot:TRINITY_DN1106_c0_g1_i3.p1 TRINITY_DN1106_c0_g1~~TRINITY_DN1106_c0_g1_i3.p1  ORF type:complete len:247 (-),score=54.97 TRINITY_DN1106_c0_g1_i3:529-1269(-)
MDPDLPKGSQYRSMCPERPLANYNQENNNPKEFKLAQIRAEAAVARKEEALRDSVEKAKWTAVHQHVDYDQYRQLCLGATLKPVAPGAIEGIMNNKSEAKTRRSRRRGQRGDVRHIQETPPEPTEPPQDRDEFDRQWRAASGDPGRRFRYLRMIPRESFARIMQVEIGFDLLGEIIASLHECWSEETDAPVVLGILTALPQAFRFDLAVTFLGAGEKSEARSLIERLCAAGALGDEELAGLEAHFQ